MSNDYLIRLKLERNSLREKVDRLSVFSFFVSGAPAGRGRGHKTSRDHLPPVHSGYPGGI